MIAQLGAAAENAPSVVVVVGKVEEAVRAEPVGDGTASSLGLSLSFCMGAAAAVVVAVFSANYYDAHRHSSLMLCLWHYCLLVRYPHPGSRGCQAGTAR